MQVLVVNVSADEIELRENQTVESDTYKLLKFKRTNSGTCINQRPIVDKGEIVFKNQVIADGPATDLGEIALGKNIRMGFMTWEGYNYEDAMLIT